MKNALIVVSLFACLSSGVVAAPGQPPQIAVLPAAGEVAEVVEQVVEDAKHLGQAGRRLGQLDRGRAEVADQRTGLDDEGLRRRRAVDRPALEGVL